MQLLKVVSSTLQKLLPLHGPHLPLYVSTTRGIHGHPLELQASAEFFVCSSCSPSQLQTLGSNMLIHLFDDAILISMWQKQLLLSFHHQQRPEVSLINLIDKLTGSCEHDM